jgi:hypothetical protein
LRDRIRRKELVMSWKQRRDPEMLDRLEQAFERERGHRRRPVWPLELDTVYAHVFKCVCCERTRPDEQRQEPRSEVCLRCVREAGFVGG